MSVPQESIGDILSGKAEVSAPVEVKAETTDVKAAPSAAEQKTEVDKAEKAAQARDEAGKFAKVETPEEPQKQRAEVAAIIDERRKRQAAEKRLAEIEAQKPATIPSVFDNEDAAIRTRVDEGTKLLREQNYNLSVRLARMEHGDAFSEAEQAFAEAIEQDPRLLEGLRTARDPGEYIFTLGLQIKELADVGGDFLKYREKVTGALKGEVSSRDERIKALEAQVEALTKSKSELEQIPTSLNARASASTGNAEAVTQEPLSQLTRFGKPNR
jgi:hypothetical protein